MADVIKVGCGIVTLLFSSSSSSSPSKTIAVAAAAAAVDRVVGRRAELAGGFGVAVGLALGVVVACFVLEDPFGVCFEALPSDLFGSINEWFGV